MGARGVLRTVEHGGVSFHCPGCRRPHVVFVGPQRRDGRARWGFNGDYDAPTFDPSVMVEGVQDLTDDEHAQLMRGDTVEPRPLVCHSFVRNGEIQFLSDCTHVLAGQTVALRRAGEAE